ncbi:hypothetical protein MPER_04846 [Moniliophthora perniciosa FA553]|nr:hypothetical protein MPER_04846 [Moniliophthora perniciosa FA553]
MPVLLAPSDYPDNEKDGKEGFIKGGGALMLTNCTVS